MAKKTIEEKFDRLNRVRSLLVAGKLRADVCFILSKEWNVSYRMVDKYIAVVYKQVKDHFESNGGMDDLLSKYNDLYNKLYELKKYSEAAKIQDSIAKITQTTKIEVTQTVYKIKHDE